MRRKGRRKNTKAGFVPEPVFGCMLFSVLLEIVIGKEVLQMQFLKRCANVCLKY